MRGLCLGLTLVVATPSLAQAPEKSLERAPVEPPRRSAVFINPLQTIVFFPLGILFLSGGASAPVTDRFDAAFEVNFATQLTCHVFDAPCANMKIFAGTLSFPFHPTGAGTSRGFFIAPKLTSAFALGDAFRRTPGQNAFHKVGVGGSASVGLDVGIRADTEFGYLALIVGASLGYGTNIPITSSDDSPGQLHGSALSEWEQSVEPLVGNGLVFDLNLQFAQIGLWF